MKTARRWAFVAVFTAAGLTIGGCPGFSVPGLLDSLQPVEGGGILDGDSSADLPPIESGRVAVAIQNRTAYSATARVAMELAGTPVFDATREVPAGATEVLVGPDNADRIHLAATVQSAPPREVAPETLTLGGEFGDGDTFPFIIDLLEDPPVQDPPQQDPPELPELLVAGGTEDVTVEAGTPVFLTAIFSDPFPDSDAEIIVDGDGTIGNEDDILVASGIETSGTTLVEFDTAGLSPGDYQPVLILDDADTTETILSEGQVSVEAPVVVAPEDPIIEINGVADVVRVVAGEDVTITARFIDPFPDTVADLFLDLDDDPTNDPGIPLEFDVPTEGETDVVFNTIELSPGDYFPVLRLEELTQLANGALPVLAEASPGGVQFFGPPAVLAVNFPPELSFIEPTGDTSIDEGTELLIELLAGDRDGDDVDVTIFFDTDGVADSGDETVIDVATVAGVDQLVETALETGELDPDLDYFYIGATADDGFETWTRYAGKITVIGQDVRLTGVFTYAELKSMGRAANIAGPVSGGQFGFSVDVFPDADDDGYDEILCGAPGLNFDPFDGFSAGDYGAVYFLANPEGGWIPSTYILDVLDKGLLYATGNAALGQTLATLADLTGDGRPEFATGAPQSADSSGAAYLAEGSLWDDPNAWSVPVDLDHNAPITAVAGGQDGEAAGAALGPLGDLNADQEPDWGIVSSLYDVQIESIQVQVGATTFIRGNRAPVATGPGIPSTDGLFVSGSLATPLNGAIDYANDLDGDGDTEAVIGNPTAPVAQDLNAGTVLIVNGKPDFFDGPYTTPDTKLLVGAQADSLHGASVATVDFNADGLDDIIIGAPGYNNQRGRVYIVFGNSDLPAAIPLTALGLLYPGIVIEGAGGGDNFGSAVASAGDFDRDGIEDLIIGAPGVNQSTGAAYLLYGGQTGSSFIDLASPSGSLEYLQVKGTSVYDRFGAALARHGGRLTDDDFDDCVIGAPQDKQRDGGPGYFVVLFGGPEDYFLTD